MRGLGWHGRPYERRNTLTFLYNDFNNNSLTILVDENFRKFHVLLSYFVFSKGGEYNNVSGED